MTDVLPPKDDRTPKESAALTYTANLINAAWHRANTKANAFNTKVDRLIEAFNINPLAKSASRIYSTLKQLMRKLRRI